MMQAGESIYRMARSLAAQKGESWAGHGRMFTSFHDCAAGLEHRYAALGFSREAFKSAKDKCWDECARASKRIDSEIEAALVPAIVMGDYGKICGMARFHSNDTPRPRHPVTFTTQVRFGIYRLDFLFACRDENGIRMFCVECDGATTHSAQHDNVRDEFLGSFGIETIRIQGRDIWRNPFDAAAPIYSMARTICGDPL